MAHVEPMDLDDIESDFDNKENTFHINDSLPRVTSIEKGHENLDVSEVNMKVKCSISQGSSMSKSFTSNYTDSKNISLVEDHNIVSKPNLTQSLNSALANCDGLLKSPKSLPLQIIPGQSVDLDGNIIKATFHASKNNINVNIDRVDMESLSLPSINSSLGNTPEATTPTKEIPKDGGSPIMRGLKSVLNMFRSSQSPIPPVEYSEDENKEFQESLVHLQTIDIDSKSQSEAVLASTPINNKNRKSNSSLKDSLTFNDDLERELHWKEDSAVFFKTEKVPLHILFPTLTSSSVDPAISNKIQENKNISLEYMDISLNETITDGVKTIEQTNVNTDINHVESDCEFQDCETTLNNSEVYHRLANEQLTANNFNIDNRVVQSDLEIENNEFGSRITESNHCSSQEFDVPPNTVFINKNDVVNKSTDPYKNNITDIDSHLNLKVTSDAMHMDAMAGTSLQNTELENKAIKLNETVDKCSDKENSLATALVDHVHSEEILNRDLQNINFDNEDKTINETISCDSQLATEYFIHSESTDNLYKSHNIQPTVEPKPQQTSVEINYQKPNETQLHTENLLYCNTKDKVLEDINIDPAYSNETYIKTVSNNEDILDVNETINVNSGVNGSLTINTNIRDNNNGQVNPIESYVEQENCTDSKSESKALLIENLAYTTETNVNGEENNKNSVLPDVVCSNDKPEFTLNGEEVIDHNHDIEKIDLSDHACMNVDTLENHNEHDSTHSLNTGILQENSVLLKAQMAEQLASDISEMSKNAINEIDYQNTDIVKSIQTGTTEIANATIDFPNLVKDVSEDHSMSVEDHMSLTMNKNDDLNLQSHTLQQNPVSISDAFHEDTNISSQYNIVDKTIDLQIEMAKENKEYALEIPTPTLRVMNDLIPQEEFSVNIGYTENENATLSKEDFEFSLPNKYNNIESEKEVLKEIEISTENLKPENHIISNVTITVDNNQSDANLLHKNFDRIDLEMESNVEINAVNASDFNSTITNKDAFEIHCTESQESPCKLHEDDVDDLEVENINTTQSQNTMIGESSFETESELLKTPPASPKIESKGYNLNFDDIDNPFATKTNIRLSPPASPCNDSFRIINTTNISSCRKISLQNKRKSQQLPKKENVCKKQLDSTFTNTVLDVKENNIINLNETQSIQPPHTNDVSNRIETEENVNETNIDAQVVVAKNSQLDNIINDRSHELNVSYDHNKRNVFNIPEIGDSTFSPFTTRTKVCLTPPLVNNTFNVEDGIEFLESNKNVTVIVSNEDSKESAENQNYIELSRHEDETLKEVNTEDEDTIEGPFLEVEDLGDIKKDDELFRHEKHDLMTPDDFPIRHNEEAENEMFIDAEAFEFLLNQNQDNVVADSGKESLFLKFDPLFAKRVSSDGILAALSNFHKKQSTPKKEKQPEKRHLYDEATVFSSCSQNIPTYDHIDESLVSNPSKPTMVVNPAIAPARNAATPPKINRQSLTFTSPAMAVIDKLLSLSGNSSTSPCHDTSLPQNCSEHHHTDVALTQLREMLADKEMHVQVLRNERKELTSRLGALESQVKALEFESEDRLRKIKCLNNELSEKNKQNKNMATVVEEYERTIATLVAELQQDKKTHAEERMRLIGDRDEQTAHLASMEISFNDLHSKYEKSKQIILSLKANEDTLKKSLQDFADSQIKIQNNYELLKQHATAKLNHANQELEKLNKGHEAEVLKLKAMMKRKDMHISSLEETLAQKTKANEELTAICDELINKVG